MRPILDISKLNHGANRDIIMKARKLRRSMTSAEKLFWELVRERNLDGHYFRRQHPFGPYIIDFYCHKASLAVEIDGGIHIPNSERDKEREEYLISCGLKVIRFKNEDLIERKQWVLDKLVKHLDYPDNLNY